MDKFDYIKIKKFSSLKDIKKVKAMHRLGETNTGVGLTVRICR